MKNIITTAIACAAFALMATPCLAQPLQPGDADRAQVEMSKREDAVWRAYMATVGLDESYLSYCQTSMELATKQPADGQIPFGVNYSTLGTVDKLRLVISVREAFETNFVRLCLADARARLNSARSH
jgi:hypothetical protein